MKGREESRPISTNTCQISFNVRPCCFSFRPGKVMMRLILHMRRNRWQSAHNINSTIMIRVTPLMSPQGRSQDDF